MNLIVFQSCIETDRKIGEYTTAVEWSESLPSVSDLISMGLEKRWQVVQVLPYQPSALGFDVEKIYFAHVNPIENSLPDPIEWEFNTPSQETMFLQISAVGEKELGLGFDMRGQSPKIGEPLFDYHTTDHPTLMRANPNGWKVDRVETYLPLHQSPALPQIHLCWCVQQGQSEDQKDLSDALIALEEAKKEGTVSWESIRVEALV